MKRNGIPQSWIELHLYPDGSGLKDLIPLHGTTFHYVSILIPKFRDYIFIS